MNAGSSPASSMQASRYSRISSSVSRCSAEYQRVVLIPIALYLQLPGNFFGLSDISILGTFIATGQKYHDNSVFLYKIDSVTGPVEDSQLTHAFPDGCHIAEMAHFDSINSGLNSSLRPSVLEGSEPFPESSCRPDFYYMETVVHMWQYVNCGSHWPSNEIRVFPTRSRLKNACWTKPLRLGALWKFKRITQG